MRFTSGCTWFSSQCLTTKNNKQSRLSIFSNTLSIERKEAAVIENSALCHLKGPLDCATAPAPCKFTAYHTVRDGSNEISSLFVRCQIVQRHFGNGFIYLSSGDFLFSFLDIGSPAVSGHFQVLVWVSGKMKDITHKSDTIQSMFSPLCQQD